MTRVGLSFGLRQRSLRAPSLAAAGPEDGKLEPVSGSFESWRTRWRHSTESSPLPDPPPTTSTLRPCSRLQRASQAAADSSRSPLQTTPERPAIVSPSRPPSAARPRTRPPTRSSDSRVSGAAGAVSRDSSLSGLRPCHSWVYRQRRHPIRRRRRLQSRPNPTCRPQRVSL